ncbi:PhoX family phosphatase [Actinokineospora sp. NBRC 105648]|uniref:PhoX family protein n=1 Tax=Actinokineospora sp. NBRC 105648 TaxID=3032206 RepID=UPI0024A39E3C|nr:PhoX family phosphatase [Actinokineospora sp. NBRC 105648]GLZ37450.1 phosphatase [Actinokineospora sp. NBRC 105648]
MSPTDGRISLPLLPPNHPLGRSSVTCEYRCANACSHEAPNSSDNAYFGDVVRSIVSRRGMLKAGAVLAVAGAGVAATGTAAAAAPVDAAGAERHRPGRPARGLNFEAVAPNREDRIVTPAGYQSAVVIRWGDAVLPGAPAFDFDNQTAAAQAKQFGYNNDFCGLVPLDHDSYLMGSNHEYTTESFMFKGYNAATPTEEQVKIGWAGHGFSVVRVDRERRSGKLLPRLDRKYNRRITVTSKFEFTGPAAGSQFLRTTVDPTGRQVFGTFGNCAGGVTPWGTILSGEENFNGYFGNGDKVTDPVAVPRIARYGTPKGESTRKWERFDPRFDLSKDPNEFNRHGWIVEIDPLEPNSTPVKHTALGRFKHEGATIQVARDGRVVCYLGDDERFDYIYKFVSKERYRPGNSSHTRAHNKKLLTEGTLYVAQFTGDSPATEFDGTGKLPADGAFDGSGKWIKLVSGNESFVEGFTAEEVYVFTRLAADKVGATKMDRPEDVQPNPVTGRVYAALTNNTDRGKPGKEGPTEINPRNGNRHGHVLEWEEARGDHTATTFAWRLLLVCGDPTSPDTYFGGYDKTQVSPISCPDNVAFDRYGNLWIATDGNALGSNDGLFAVPTEGRERGHLKQFLTVPVGAETCGPVVEEDFILVSVQHPGELDGASADNPLAHWPDGGTSQPRPSVAVIWKSGCRVGD